MSDSFQIVKNNKYVLPNIPFEDIKDFSLGKKYDLSLAFISPAKMKQVNLQYRNVDKTTDILSFPISKSEGQIFICAHEAKKEARKFERSYVNFIAFLFIHGCSHLKGYDHGSKMDSIEKKIRDKFGI